MQKHDSRSQNHPRVCVRWKLPFLSQLIILILTGPWLLGVLWTRRFPSNGQKTWVSSHLPNLLCHLPPWLLIVAVSMTKVRGAIHHSLARSLNISPPENDGPFMATNGNCSENCGESDKGKHVVQLSPALPIPNNSSPENDDTFMTMKENGEPDVGTISMS